MYDLGPKDTIPLKEILCKCHVVSKSTFNSKFGKSGQKTPKSKRLTSLEGKYFFCYRGIDTKLGKISDGLSWKDIESGKDISPSKKKLCTKKSVKNSTLQTKTNSNLNLNSNQEDDSDKESSSAYSDDSEDSEDLKETKSRFIPLAKPTLLNL